MRGPGTGTQPDEPRIDRASREVRQAWRPGSHHARKAGRDGAASIARTGRAQRGGVIHRSSRRPGADPSVRPGANKVRTTRWTPADSRACRSAGTSTSPLPVRHAFGTADIPPRRGTGPSRRSRDIAASTARIAQFRQPARGPIRSPGIASWTTARSVGAYTGNNAHGRESQPGHRIPRSRAVVSP